MANETVFTNKAADYAAGRPGYAPQAIAYILENMIKDTETAADIGSGTGILAKEFFLRRVHTYCVEPNDDMRSETEKMYGTNPYFHSIAASAEHTGLPENSMKLITAASAFHWFDPQAFQKECLRILQPDGMVCLLVNARVYDDFTGQQREICGKYCPAFTSFTHGMEKTLARAEGFFSGNYHTEHFSFPLSYTKEKFIRRSLSSSYAPICGTAEYDAYIRDLQKLLDRCFSGDTITVANETVMLWGKIR